MDAGPAALRPALFKWLAGAPALQMALDEGGKASSPLLIVVQAGNEGKALAAFSQESIATSHLHLFERLEAVREKPGAHYINVLDSVARPGAQSGFGIRLQPLLRPETALKRHVNGLTPLAQFAGQQVGGFH